MIPPPHLLGRTGEIVSSLWRDLGDGTIDAGEWLALTVHRDALDRKGYDRLHERLLRLDRKPDLIIMQDVLANDIKAGWPMHRMQQFRERGACRYFAVEVESPLEAEWIAANVMVHAVILPYHPEEMSARYRAFEAAQNASVALMGRARTASDASLQLATPELHGTIVPHDLDVQSIAPLAPEAVDSLWEKYAATHEEPPKLRGAHPPDEG